MHSLLLKIAGFFTASSGGVSIWSGLAILFGCILPLILFQCSSSRLEDLQTEYSMLEGKYGKLQLELGLAQTSLQQCRQAASLNDAVIARHQQANIEIRQKYDRLREELMRGLLPLEMSALQEEVYESAEMGEDATTDAAMPDKSFKDWCVEPVPALLRGLLLSPGGAAILP